MDNSVDQNNVRKYFLLSQGLYKRADEIGTLLGLNFSEVLRKALEDFVSKKEKEKIDKDIAEACKFYYNVDKEIAADWRAAEEDI